jgi:acyl-CoA oxidase
MNDHKPLPGVKVGDLGAKLGYNFVDNGWLSFDHVRIPRSDMLSRFVKVKKDGSVEARGDPRVTY